MPTPIEILLDPISLTILAMYGLLMAWEAGLPGRPLPVVAGWRWRGLVAFTGYFYLSSYLPLLWDQYLAPYQLLDLSGLGVAGGAAVGLVVYELGVYAWHRALHGSTTLWRGFHQMHHSAERLDTFGAFYFSPLDMVGWTALSSLCLTLGVGVVPQAATIILLATTWMAFFQHANIRTPQWLGYALQRPESHTVHHARGIHDKNYSDLPLIDILFGTFENPRGYELDTGFYDGASARVWDMLCLRDITEPAPTVPPMRAETRLEHHPIHT